MSHNIFTAIETRRTRLQSITALTLQKWSTVKAPVNTPGVTPKGPLKLVGYVIPLLSPARNGLLFRRDDGLIIMPAEGDTNASHILNSAT
jgi:hypothetical protein